MQKLRYFVLAAAMVIGTANAAGWSVATDTSTVGFAAEQQGAKGSNHDAMDLVHDLQSICEWYGKG